MKFDFHIKINGSLLLKIGLAILTIVLLGGGLFYLAKKQLNSAKQLAEMFKTENEASLMTSLPTQQNSLEEIEKLKKEIEELKLKASLKPTSPSPLPDLNLKTQKELEEAKKQISSLQQQLKEIQTNQSTSTSSSAIDADISSWQMNEKVVQIACQDKITGNWQLGSGVLISEDGKILTNQHVVKPTIGIWLPDYCLALFDKDFDSVTKNYKREYRATITGFFEGRDAALLKIQDVVYLDKNNQIQNAPLINNFRYFHVTENRPQIGDAVYIAGFPESANFSFSVTKGIISNFSSDGLYFGTDAQIDRGNSGGAALNSKGELIGLPTYKFVNSGDYRGYILDIHSINLNL